MPTNDDPQLPPEFFSANRQNFMEAMEESSLAVFHGTGEVVNSADEFYRYRQTPNFFYLTGIEQPECILMLSPDNRKGETERLFIPEPDEKKETWIGEMLDMETAREISGIDRVQYLDDFDGAFTLEQEMLEHLYIDYEDEGFRYPTARRREFSEKVRSRLPGLQIKKANPVLSGLRRVKSPGEIELIRKTVNITVQAIRAVWAEVKPDLREYQLEAVLVYHFLWKGARNYAFDPIIASGSNATVLHYINNTGTLRDGEVLLTDVGARYGQYCADLTRTVPVNGRFTDRQKEVYQAVLEVQKQMIQEVKPGVHVDELNRKAGDLIGENMVTLDLISDKEDYNQYYMHRIGHFLGLNTHDVGTYTGPLEPNCVITIEPGIYIPEEHLGVRIEDDVLVTENGCEVLSDSLPKEPDELEELIGG